MHTTCLTDFHSIRPIHESLQQKTLDWILKAHTQAEALSQGMDIASEKAQAFEKELKERLLRVGCKPDHIAKRGHVIDDFLHQNWDKMKIYVLDKLPSGACLKTRLNVFDEVVDPIFEEYYPEGASPPDDLIHATCTGYIAPSGAQKIVSKRGWGTSTTVTHAYHMGCYSAISSIRLADGFLFRKNSSDIIHTELCSLHTNPSNHSPDQLVSQSLFADGFIKYTAKKKAETAHLKVLGIHEEIISDSTEAMKWNLADWGFQISLAKEVPVLIAKALQKYLENLCAKSSLRPEDVLKNAHFAIHPGGPKIIKYIQQYFRLENEQIEKSKLILKQFGNMSSATLPHIWDAILQDPKVDSGTWIVSMAFGPGLSICGALMQKE